LRGRLRSGQFDAACHVLAQHHPSQMTTIRVMAMGAIVCMTAMACTSTTAPAEADSTITPLVFNTETFAGTLDVAGTGFYSFNVAQAGPVGLTLAAVQTPG